MDTLWQDVRFALRSMLKSPVLTAITVLLLALGIGANTTIFTVLNAIFLSPLPVERPSELVAVYTSDQQSKVVGLGNLLPVSNLNFKDLRANNKYLADMAAYSVPMRIGLIANGEPQPAFSELVTGNYFTVLGVKPERGRFFSPEEDTVPGRDAVAVLSFGCWQRRFGGDPTIVGGTASVNGAPFAIIGIAPRGFNGVNSLFSPDIWIPSMMYAQVLPTALRPLMNERRALMFLVAARLRPGATLKQAEANLESIATGLEREYPIPNKGRGVALRPLAQATILPGFRDAFVIGSVVLMTIVSLVLLIVCSNIASLLLSRAIARRHEIAVRVALGASRSRIVRQLLTESMLIAALGGAFAIIIAILGRRGIVALRPAFLAQNFVDLSFDARVVTFTAFVSVATGLVFGFIPALRASATDVAGELKEDARGRIGGRRHFALRGTLVVTQVALSVIALVAAGLFIRSLQVASAVNPGFDVDHLAVVTVNPGEAGYDQSRSKLFYRSVREHIASIGGVRSTAWSSSAPLGIPDLRTIVKEGEDANSNAGRIIATIIIGSEDYFRTLGIQVLRGRGFDDGDREGGNRVAVVNQVLADRLWPNADPIGRRFRFFTDTIYHTVVGVAKTSKYTTLGEDPQPAAYIALEQNSSDVMVLAINAAGSPAKPLGNVQREIRSLDPNVPLSEPFTMREILMQSLWAPRLAAILLGAFALLALLLATVGLYGVVAHSVNQRLPEIGLRMALGANRGRVLTMVMREAMSLVFTGLVAGIAAAFALSRFVSRLLFGVSPVDPATFGVVAVLLTFVGLAATCLPALRASRVNPVELLR